MIQDIKSHHYTDADGNPAGGTTSSCGLAIIWQNGPLLEDGVRKEPNGCFVETTIVATIDRLEFYQASKFACEYNQTALDHLRAALYSLQRRTDDREKRGVEGTHTT